MVFAAVATVRIGVGEVLRTVQLDRHARLGTEQVHLESTAGVEGDRQPLIEAEPSFRLGQAIQSPEQERLCRAARAIDPLCVRMDRPGRVKEQAGKGRVHAIAHEPLHAARVVPFPRRVGG